MSKKKRKKFANSRIGGIIGLFIVLTIITAFVLSLLPSSTSSRDRDKEQAEWEKVQTGIQTIMTTAVPPIEDFSSDHRVLSFANAGDQATKNMLDGGLIDFSDEFIASGSITALNEILQTDRTFYKYWLQPGGVVYQVVD